MAFGEYKPGYAVENGGRDCLLAIIDMKAACFENSEESGKLTLSFAAMAWHLYVAAWFGDSSKRLNIPPYMTISLAVWLPCWVI